MALPLLFFVAGNVVRAATPVVARALVRQGAKKATQTQIAKQSAKPVVVTSVKQVSKLKPKAPNLKSTTKVANKKPSGSMKQQTTKPKDNTLRAKPEDRIVKTAPKKAPKNTALGTPGQRKLLAAGSSAATIASMVGGNQGPKKAQADKKKQPPKRTPIHNVGGQGPKSAGQKAKLAKKLEGQIAEAAKGNKPTSWKDFKSVKAAQAKGSNYFMGRDGKKKLAITKEQLKKKYPKLSAAEALRKHANSLKG